MKTADKGFTLVEVVIILVVVGILAAISIPLLFRIFQVTAEDATRNEMQNLKQAMIGNPTKLNGTVRADFGFLGDIGCLPTTAFPSAPALDRLLTAGTLPTPFNFNAAKQAGAGWNGPYITGAATGQATAEFENDQWGNPYTYLPAAGVCPMTATLTSNGPDGTLSTSDDITLSIVSIEGTTTTVRGVLKTSAGDRVPSAPVDINYPVNGTLTTSTFTTDTNGVYTSNISIPFGKRSVQPRPTLVYAPNTGMSETGSGGQAIQFTIFNMSSSAVTITSLVATFNDPNTTYQGVVWNGVLVNSATLSSGQTATFSAPRTIALSTSTPPAQAVIVDKPDVQLPDLIVFPQGTSALIELLNFNNPSNSSVVGIPFTITFSNGSVIRFTPANGG